MEAWAGLPKAIRDVTDPRVLMDRTVEGVLAFVPNADGAAVELVDDLGLVYVSASGALEPYVGTRLAKGTGLSGLAIDTGTVLRCDDTETDPRVDRAFCRTLGIVSVICVPLVCGEEAVGVVRLTARVPRAFSDADVATLEEVAGFVCTVVKSAAELTRTIGNWQRPTAAESGAGPVGGGLGEHGSPRSSVATFVGEMLRPGITADLEARDRIETLLLSSSFNVHFQPIVDLARGTPTAVEALARFPGLPELSTEAVFAEATRTGLGPELELATLEAATCVVSRLPPQVSLAVNIGPGTIGHPWLLALLGATEPGRVVLELTEHTAIDDYLGLRGELRALRDVGVRLSVDDAGSGYSSLTHILDLAPDFIKLDLSLTRGIDMDPVRRSLATALVTFAEDSGGAVVAEGIETVGELETLKGLGAHFGQGYYLGRPVPLEALDLATKPLS